MANFDVKSIWLLSVFAICVLSLCLYHKMVAAEEDCEEEFRGLNIECYYYMHSGDPTLIFPNDRCCKAITHAYPKLQRVCNILYRKVRMLLLSQYFFFECLSIVGSLYFLVV